VGRAAEITQSAGRFHRCTYMVSDDTSFVDRAVLAVDGGRSAV